MPIRIPTPFILIFLAALLTAPAGAIQVTSTSPAQYALNVPKTLTTIAVAFDVVPDTPAAGAVRVAGTMSGLHGGTVSVVGNEIRFQNTSEPFMPGELVSVNIRNDVAPAGGGSALTNGYYFAFTIASAPSSPTWQSRKAFGASLRPYFIHGGDLDEDGMPDIALPNEDSNNVSVMLNTSGDGDFDVRNEYGVGLTPSSIYGDDFDNDGYQDLATADIASGTMSVLMNDGDGTFAPRVPHAAGLSCRQVHGGDFDGDNDVDLCTTDNGNGEVYLFYNNGDGTFATGVTYTDVGSGPFPIFTGDFDRDGRLDIAVGNQASDTVSILLNVGGGTFITVNSYFAGNGPWDMHGNDFDGDGDYDLIVADAFGNQISVLINNGAGAFPTRIARSTDSFPLGIFSADLDGDGDIDAMASNFSGGSVNVFDNTDGDGDLQITATLDMPQAGTFAWAHDVNGDGRLDISTTDELADSVFVYLNDSIVSVNEVPPVVDAGVSVWPNPIRSAATIALDVSIDAAGVVDVYGVDGRRIRRLALGANRARPTVEWDGRDEAGRPVASGKYLIAVSAGDRSYVRSVYVLR